MYSPDGAPAAKTLYVGEDVPHHDQFQLKHHQNLVHFLLLAIVIKSMVTTVLPGPCPHI